MQHYARNMFQNAGAYPGEAELVRCCRTSSETDVLLLSASEALQLPAGLCCHVERPQSKQDAVAKHKIIIAVELFPNQIRPLPGLTDVVKPGTSPDFPKKICTPHRIFSS